MKAVNYWNSWDKKNTYLKNRQNITFGKSSVPFHIVTGKTLSTEIWKCKISFSSPIKKNSLKSLILESVESPTSLILTLTQGLSNTWRLKFYRPSKRATLQGLMFGHAESFYITWFLGVCPLQELQLRRS